MSGTDLKAELAKLARTGCQGNAADFTAWLKFAGVSGVSTTEVSSALADLEGEGLLKKHPEFTKEYLSTKPDPVGTKVSYSVSSNLEDSPIQMVRSRLDYFLDCHNAPESLVIDMTIAVTEAMENAVKYSSGGNIDITYHITDGVFNIRVVNQIAEASPQDDIESGKYSSSVTLMRGMMVMVKLFDEMDIDIQEEKGAAVFTGSKKF